MFQSIVRAIIVLLVPFVLFFFPHWVYADITFTPEHTLYQIEELTKKVDWLATNESKNKEGDFDKIISLVNLQMQVIMVILAFVAIAIPTAGYFLRRSVKNLEEKARLSVGNMDKKVREISSLEKAIVERKKQFDAVYAELEKKEKGLINKLKAVKGKSMGRNKLSEIEEEILDLKRKLSQAIQPYVTYTTSYPGVISGSWPGTTTTYTSTSPSANPGTTTNTTI